MLSLTELRDQRSQPLSNLRGVETVKDVFNVLSSLEVDTWP